MRADERNVLLFSYGTLQDEVVQRQNFGRTLKGRRDSMPGYTQEMVAIADASVVALRGKTHHPIVMPSDDPSSSVAGVVFEVTTEELAAADAYEVSDYRRIRVTLVSGASAWVYVKA